MSLGGGRPVGQGDHLEGNLTGARRPATPGRSVGFEAGPAAGWRGQRERAEPSASCLPYLPEVDSLSILVIVLLLILTLMLGSLTGLCVWRRRRKRSGESRAPGCCHLTGQCVPGRAAPAFPWELWDLWVPGPAVGAGPPPWSCLLGRPLPAPSPSLHAGSGAGAGGEMAVEQLCRGGCCPSGPGKEHEPACFLECSQGLGHQG